MTPHPILMQSLYDDRTREVEALLLQRQHVEQGNAMRAPGLASWHRLAIRILAPLALPHDLGKSKATRRTAAA
jgi:hypothetical protein